MLYWFLTWEDWTTAITVIVLFVVGLGSYVVVAMASVKLQTRPNTQVKLVVGDIYSKTKEIS